MRAFVVAALSTAAYARGGMGGHGPRGGGMWYGGAPDCAKSCLSSVYSEETESTVWPEPGHFCTADAAAPLSSCLEASCTATPTAWSSMESLHSSLCSLYSSCTADPSAVYTITYPTPTGTGRYSAWHGTYTGDGTVVVTGCPTGGYGSGGYGPGGYGGPWGPHHHGGGGGWGGPWGGDYGDGNYDDAFWGWGSGWSSLTTITETVTMDVSGSASLVVETYAQAVSDGETTTSPLAAQGMEISSSSSPGRGTADPSPTGTGLGVDGGTNSCVGTGTGTGTNGACLPAATGADSNEDSDDNGGNSAASANGVAFVGAGLAAVIAIAGLL